MKSIQFIVVTGNETISNDSLQFNVTIESLQFNVVTDDGINTV